MTRAQLVGVFLFFSPFVYDGALFAQAQHRVFYDKDGLLISSERGAAYYRNYFVDKDGLQTGIVKDYYMNELLKWEGAFLHLNWEDDSKSILDGPCQWYHPNGQRECFATYEIGKLEGLRQIWDENGALIREEEYREGKLHGKCVHYSEQGRVLLRLQYKDGQLVAKPLNYLEMALCFSKDSNFYKVADAFLLNSNFCFDTYYSHGNLSYMYNEAYTDTGGILTSITVGSDKGANHFVVGCLHPEIDTVFINFKRSIQKNLKLVNDNLVNYFSSFEVYEVKTGLYALLDKKNEVVWMMNEKKFKSFSEPPVKKPE